MTRGSVIRRVIVCVALGLVTTVVVAWGFAFIQPKPAMAVVGSWYSSRESWGKARLSDGGRHGIWRRETQWYGAAWTAGKLMRVQEPPMRHEPWGLSDAQRAQRLGRSGARVTTEIGTGWPMPALWYAFDGGAGAPVPATMPPPGVPLFMRTFQPPVLLNGARLPDAWVFDGRAAGEPVVLPLSPILLGVAVDALVFAAVWVGLIVVWPMTLGRRARRARRRRRGGLCIECGYDLRGNAGAGCPECGWGK